MDKFTNRILAYIRRQDLIRTGDIVVTAFSGGADSMALLGVLHELTGLLGIRLCAAHVNHGLRGEEAKRDELFCRETAERMEIPFHAVSVDVASRVRERGFSTEEAARELRYEALAEIRNQYLADAGGAERVLIAAAHHADDQAETVLLNLLRGTGLRGLSGMAPCRGNLIRPLLCVSHEEILTWLSGKQLSYVTDSTNLSDDYTRNFLRNRILPELSGRVNARAADHIQSAAAICRAADDYLRSEAAEFLNEQLSGTQETGEREIAIPVRLLKEKPQIFRRYVIIEALGRIGAPLKNFGERHLSDLDKALFQGKGFHLDLPNGVYAENKYRMTVISYLKAGDGQE
ncbi:MAG: tRNA lysidine(34) synthetase TilS [Eubacteriales bacterium]|nr:tRNA lysidine(34) synthetase TilS [Eubacteriales bacterium]